MATFLSEKSCHSGDLNFFFLAIIMASYFGMPNHGNSFVKTKWLEKCPLERMPSFKTVSEHCKCLVVDELTTAEGSTEALVSIPEARS